MIINAIVFLNEGIIAFMDLDLFFNSKTIPFSIRLFFEWDCIAMVVATLFAAGLQSRLYRWQLILFPSLVLLSVVIAICYHYFVGVYTELHSWRDIVYLFAAHKDVQVKVFIFCISLFATSYLLYVPLYTRIIKKKVKATKWMYIYLFFAHFQPICYFFYTLGSPVSGVLLSIGCLSFMIIFSIAFIRNENPLVYELEETPKKLSVVAKSVDQLSQIIKENKLFLKKNLSIEELYNVTGISSYLIITDYKKKGFKSFIEYLNAFRIVYFKELCVHNPRVPIANLAADSGFNSRASFYRYFESMEGCSPAVYVENKSIKK